MRSRYKYELAEAAGVSPATFRRWLKKDEMYLRMNGVTPSSRILPPQVVEFLCRKYCIDL